MNHVLASFIDIYDGVDPTDVPHYQVSEASFCLRLPASTIRSWVIGENARVTGGTATARNATIPSVEVAIVRELEPPLILMADPARKLLSFNNLVELHVLGMIRRSFRVRMPAVRRAMTFLQERFESRQPLLNEQMLTDGRELFVEQYDQLVNVSQDGQMVMKDLIRQSLNRIDRDPGGMPFRLFPYSRLDPEESSPKIVAIDPRIRFGRPCIAGTNLPTSIIAERYEAGDSITFLAEDYDRSLSEIEESIRFQLRSAA